MIRRSVVLAGLLALSPAVSQATVLMLVDGIAGPAKYTGYAGWFLLDSLVWHIDRSNVADPHSIAAVLKSSAAVATLIQLSASGSSGKRILFDDLQLVSQDFQSPVQRLTCEDPIIRSSSLAAQPSTYPSVQLQIRCGRLSWEHYDYSGTTKAVSAVGKGSWNFKTNTP